MIIGLGNPGRTYARHRHNIGFRVVDKLGGRLGIDIKKKLFGAIVGSGVVAGKAAILVEPQGYINLSGEVVVSVANFYKIEPEDMIVVHDDLDIAFGRLKIGKGLGSGGHNGINSIIQLLGTSDFYRVRFGVGRPPANIDAADFVLHTFTDEENKMLPGLIDDAASAIELLIEKGITAAQQKYH